MIDTYKLYDNTQEIPAANFALVSHYVRQALLQKNKLTICDDVKSVYILNKDTREIMDQYDVGASEWFNFIGTGHILLGEGIKQAWNNNETTVKFLIQYDGLKSHTVWEKAPKPKDAIKYNIYQTAHFDLGWSNGTSYFDRDYRFAFNDDDVDKYRKDQEALAKQKEIEKQLHENKCKLTKGLLESKKIIAIPHIFYSGVTPRISLATRRGAKYVPKRGAYVGFKDPKFTEAVSAYFDLVDEINESVSKFVDQFGIEFEEFKNK